MSIVNSMSESTDIINELFGFSFLFTCTLHYDDSERCAQRNLRTSMWVRERIENEGADVK